MTATKWKVKYYLAPCYGKTSKNPWPHITGTNKGPRTPDDPWWQMSRWLSFTPNLDNSGPQYQAWFFLLLHLLHWPSPWPILHLEPQILTVYKHWTMTTLMASPVLLFYIPVPLLPNPHWQSPLITSPIIPGWVEAEDPRLFSLPISTEDSGQLMTEYVGSSNTTYTKAINDGTRGGPHPMDPDWKDQGHTKSVSPQEKSLFALKMTTPKDFIWEAEVRLTASIHCGLSTMFAK